MEYALCGKKRQCLIINNVLNCFNGLNLMKEINIEKWLKLDIQRIYIIHILKHMMKMISYYPKLKIIGLLKINNNII